MHTKALDRPPLTSWESLFKALLVNMLTLYGVSDFDRRVEEDWLNEYIAYIRHQRDPIPSHVKTTVQKYGDAYKGVLEYKNVYNHYVRWPTSHRTSDL